MKEFILKTLARTKINENYVVVNRGTAHSHSPSNCQSNQINRKKSKQKIIEK
jgi:hypothetical protein